MPEEEVAKMISGCLLAIEQTNRMTRDLIFVVQDLNRRVAQLEGELEVKDFMKGVDEWGSGEPS